MQKKIIIDYLNFSSAFKLIQNERRSNVIALFKPHSNIKEVLLIKILLLFRIKYSLNKMESCNFKDNLVNKIFEITKHTTNSISDEYLSKSSSKSSNLNDFSIKKWFFHALWRQISIIEYIKNLKINENSNTIYISSLVEDKLLMKSSHYQSIINNLPLVHYKTSCLINDNNYSFIRVQPKFKYVGTKISSLLEILYAVFFVKWNFKLSAEKIDFLIFSHFPEKWVGIDKINPNSALISKIVYPDGMVGSDKKNSLNIKSIDLKELVAFYIYMFNGILKFFWAFKIHSTFFSELVSKYKLSFILKSFYKKHNVKIILSGYESPIGQVATSIASDNSSMVSFDCVWSLGERPIDFAVTQTKFCDRNFLWGQWHHDLMISSNDQSSGHIIAGYIGDHLIPIMQSQAREFRNFHIKKYKKIITVFDSGSAEDGHFSEETYIQYLEAIIHTANKFNALVVLKTKKEDKRYEDIVKSNHDRLIIHYEKASLVSALGSDIVIGVASSTPASIAAVYGIKAILYDPNKQVCSKWKSYENSLVIIRSIQSLTKILSENLISSIARKNQYPKYIDSFGDFLAQNRIEKYIENIFDNLDLGKNEALKIADNLYQEEWGYNKVILKKDLIGEISEKNII